MQVTIDIPDKIPRALVNKLVMQFEEQIQAVVLDVSKTEFQEPKLSKRQASLGRGTVWMSDDFNEPLPDSF